MAVERDTFETGKGTLEIIPIHHATFVMQWDGKVIYCDPVGGAQRFGALEQPTHIILTHHHDDHLDMETLAALVGEQTQLIAPKVVFDQMPGDLQAKTRLMGNGDSAELDGFSLQAIPMYNTTPEREKYHEKGIGNGYLFDFAGTRVYLASDTEPTPEMNGLGAIDIAFFPMNLPYTMTPDQVLACIEKVRPKVAYPFHYRFPFDQIGTEPEDLIALAGDRTSTDIRKRDWYPAL